MHRRFVMMAGEAGGRTTVARRTADRWWRGPDCVLVAAGRRPAGCSPATEAEARAHRRLSLGRTLATMAALGAALAAAIAALTAFVPA
ncbi:hypothetical protein [Aquisphaera insulae]|uniref:hypothetical protein n=1 Tax=Aquisphaera insulae TaxID=2712864 RepID=UPI0013E9CB94|nr:hypothetical protein [Aquisphaera insulae]